MSDIDVSNPEVTYCILAKLDLDEHDKNISTIIECNRIWIKPDDLASGVRAWWTASFARDTLSRWPIDKAKEYGYLHLRRIEFDDEFDLRSEFSNAINRAFEDVPSFVKLTPYDERISIVQNESEY
jgi:hypothetical protein